MLHVTLLCLLSAFFVSLSHERVTQNRKGLSLDPCDDFNKYVCGQFPNENFVSIFDSMNANMYRTIAAKLRSSETPSVKKAKIFYDTCRSLTKIKRQSVSPLKRWKTLFMEKMNKANETVGNFEKFRQKLFITKSNPPFHQILLIISEINTYNTSELVTQIGRPNFYLINSFAEEVDTNTFQDNVLAEVRSIVYLGALLNERISVQDVFQIIKFESALYKIWKDNSNIALSNRTIFELNSKCSVIDFSLIRHIYETVGQIKYDKDIIIQVTSPKAIFKTCNLIETYLKTNEGFRILINYLKWSTIVAASELVYDPVLRALKKADAKNLLKGQITRKKRTTKSDLETASMSSNPIWVECLTLTDTIFSLPISLIYASTIEDPEFLTTEVETIIYNLSAELKQKIYNSSWLSNSEKEKIFEKIQRMSTSVMYPEEALNEDFIMDTYKDLDIYEGGYFENMMNAARYMYKRNLQSLTNFDFSKIFSSLEINAYYVYQQNRIFIPLGILQKPILNKNMRLFEKYSRIGFILAHEIMHGLDPLGMNFDSKGNFGSILSADSQKRFEQILLCYVDQYNSYNLPGFYELAENVADNNGLEIAIKAYEKEAKTVNETEIELFFVGMSEMMCPTRLRDNGKRSLETDPHSPNKYRVIGTMSNLKRFSEVFQCDRDSKMNPREKCTIW